MSKKIITRQGILRRTFMGDSLVAAAMIALSYGCRKSGISAKEFEKTLDDWQSGVRRDSMLRFVHKDLCEKLYDDAIKKNISVSTIPFTYSEYTEEHLMAIVHENAHLVGTVRKLYKCVKGHMSRKFIKNIAQQADFDMVELLRIQKYRDQCREIYGRDLRDDELHAITYSGAYTVRLVTLKRGMAISLIAGLRFDREKREVSFEQWAEVSGNKPNITKDGVFQLLTPDNHIRIAGVTDYINSGRFTSSRDIYCLPSTLTERVYSVGSSRPKYDST